MKKIIIIIILFFNFSISFNDSRVTVSVFESTYAQQRYDCPPVNGGGGGGFWSWVQGIGGTIVDAIQTVGGAITDFFSNIIDDDGEGMGSENDGEDFGFDGDTFVFDSGGGGNPWNDPTFNTDEWTQEEWDFVDQLGIAAETYYNGQNNPAPSRIAGAMTEMDNQPSTGTPATNLPCTNSFLLAFPKIVHFTQLQLSFISEFHFDGDNLIYFIDINGYKFVNANTAFTNNGILIDEEPTYQFVSFDRIKADLAHVNSIYGTTVTQTPDVNGVIHEVFRAVPADNMNYTFRITPDNIEAPAVGKQVEARTTSGVPYCRTLTQEDCSKALGKKRDEKYLVPGLTLDHHINLPEKFRKFLERLPQLPPCTVSFINGKLTELHNSWAYQNAATENARAQMEIMGLAYYYVFGSLYCLTDLERVKNEPCASQFGMGALHELIATVDIAQLTEALIKMVEGAGNVIANNMQVFITTAEQIVDQVGTTGNVNYEEIFKQFVQSSSSQISSDYNAIKSICENFAEMYFTGCDTHTFSDGTVGDACCYRRGEVIVMALPIIVTGGEWGVMKAGALISKYVPKSSKAIRYLDEAVENGADLSNDVNKVVVTETSDEIVTEISKEANEIKFKRDNNSFEALPDNLINVPTINGRKPINYEFAGGIYHTKSGYDVPFNQYGFPNMESFSARTVRINNMDGTVPNDFAKANMEAFGVADKDYHLTVNNGQYANYTWHHHEDTKSMMLVPKNINNPANSGVAHTGGAAIVSHNNNLPQGGIPLTFPSPPLK
jgi:hypothetical protein